MGAVTFEWQGMKELAATMRTLSSQTEAHLAYLATSAASRNVVKSAQANIQSYGLIDTGALIGNVAQARKKPLASNFSYDIGVRHGAKKQMKEDDDPWYWFMLEFGTKFYEGRHFLTQAFESEKEESLTIMQKSLTKGIARTLAKQSQTDQYGR